MLVTIDINVIVEPGAYPELDRDINVIKHAQALETRALPEQAERGTGMEVVVTSEVSDLVNEEQNADGSVLATNARRQLPGVARMRCQWLNKTYQFVR